MFKTKPIDVFDFISPFLASVLLTLIMYLLAGLIMEKKLAIELVL